MLTYIGANTTTKSTSHALLLLHAFPLSASMWQSQIEALGKTGFTVIAPNAFGIEGSEEKEGWTFTEYAHELSKLLESLGVEKVTYFTAATYTKRPELVVEAENMIRKQPIKVIIGAMRAIMMRLDASPLLSTIHCPVLVINGADDKLTTTETAKSISARIPGSQFQLIANAGHISNMEQPEDFNRALLDHIEKVRLT
ncbi:MAG: alpha/beta fold hydrolase [Chlorobiales bacterium]|nr:alpha/beta fold hydrolase [Chlorobiales bacterium]